MIPINKMGTSIDPEVQSKTDTTESEKDIPEYEIGTSDQNRDIEKQSLDELPPQQPADRTQNDLVVFDGPEDPDNPKNWSSKRKIAITISMGLMTFVVTFSSSIFSVAIEPVSKEYDIGTVTATLGVSLFLLVSVHMSQSHGPDTDHKRASCWDQWHLGQLARSTVVGYHFSLATLSSQSSTYPSQWPKMSKQLCLVASLEGWQRVPLWQ